MSRVTRRRLAEAAPEAPVLGDPALSVADYLASEAARTSWGIAELDTEEDDANAKAILSGYPHATLRCVFWGLQETAAKDLARLLNRACAVYDRARAATLRYVALARPPTTVTVGSTQWRVPEDFALCHRECECDGFAMLFSDGYLDVLKEQKQAKLAATEHEAFSDLMFAVRRATAKLPAALCAGDTPVPPTLVFLQDAVPPNEVLARLADAELADAEADAEEEELAAGEEDDDDDDDDEEDEGLAFSEEELMDDVAEEEEDKDDEGDADADADDDNDDAELFTP